MDQTPQFRDDNSQLLRYVKRRDKLVLAGVMIYLSGPTVYDWVESLDDIGGTNGAATWPADNQTERYLVTVIKLMIESKPFGWREVFKDLTR